MANLVSFADDADDPKMLEDGLKSKTIVDIKPGVRVTVIDERKDYAVQVRTLDGKTGWILRECVREIK